MDGTGLTPHSVSEEERSGDDVTGELKFGYERPPEVAGKECPRVATSAPHLERWEAGGRRAMRRDERSGARSIRVPQSGETRQQRRCCAC